MTFSDSLLDELNKLAYDYGYEARRSEDRHRYNQHTKPPKWKHALLTGVVIGAGLGGILASKGKRMRGAGIGAAGGAVAGAVYKGLRHVSIADSKHVMSMPKNRRRDLLKHRSRAHERAYDDINQELLNRMGR
jgi:uncharacterized protein YcfJ